MRIACRMNCFIQLRRFNLYTNPDVITLQDRLIQLHF